MIELRKVTIEAGNFRLEDISFQIDAGEYAVIMGKTGCGKTTILETICGLRSATNGEILLDERVVTDLPPADRNVGYVPQDLALFETMTVREHLEFAPNLRGFEPARTSEIVEKLSGLLGIGDLLERSPQGLSGGESQRVAIGRALSFEPPILLLDEPMSALDEETRDEVYELLETVRTSTGVTTLHITHSRAEAVRLGSLHFTLQGNAVKPLKSLSKKSG